MRSVLGDEKSIREKAKDTTGGYKWLFEPEDVLILLSKIDELRQMNFQSIEINELLLQKFNQIRDIMG